MSHAHIPDRNRVLNRLKRLTILVTLIALLGGYVPAIGSSLDRKVTLNLEGMALDAALNMIAEQYDLNMVVSGAENLKLSLRLKNIPLKDALDAMLLPNGFSYYKRGEVIVVAADNEASLGGKSTLYYRLKYISAAIAQKAVKAIASRSGKVEILQPDDDDNSITSVTPNAIMIHDFPEIIGQAEALLLQMDMPEHNVMIEVKMIETKIDAQELIGFNLPKSITARVSDKNSLLSSGTGGTSTTSGQLTSSVGTLDLPDGRWDWATLSADELVATIDFLQSNGKSKLISHPKLTTLENHEAVFKVTTIIPVQTINRFSQGSSTSDIVTFQDIEVGITLSVTPRINDSGLITMEVFPQIQEIIGFSGTQDQQKPITTERSVRTVVTCREGETIVIGGLLRENEIVKIEKVFFLGNIPILGGLFTHRSSQTESTDLLILITPTVMR